MTICCSIDSHPGGVRPQPRDRQALRSSARRRGLRLLRQPLPLLLGFPAARDLRARRHPARARARLPQTRRARSRPGLLARVTPPRRRDPDRRQGLRRPRVRHAVSELRRHDRPPPPQRRARPRPHLAPIRQRIESIFWTCKDILTLERHGARTLPGLRERVLQRFLASPPPSPSTTNSAAPAAHSSTTAPNRVESTTI